MIPWNITYIRPDTLEEAWQSYQEAKRKGQEVYYLNGGTELITFARQNKLHPEVFIDLSRIPELRRMETESGTHVFGAAITLNEIIQTHSFPLLARAAKIADHTVRNKLSLGGNIVGRLPYRETLLPFLVADGIVGIFGADGLRQQPLAEVYAKRLLLETGEILVDLRVPKSLVTRPWAYARKTRFGQAVDYPLVTLVLLDAGEQAPRFRCGVSGAFASPLRSGLVEQALNRLEGFLAPSSKGQLSIEESFIQQVVDLFGVPLVRDQRASSEYRRLLLEQALAESLVELITFPRQEASP